MAELWPMLVSAMQNKNGIPEKLIEMKKQEMEQNRADKETMQKFQKNIDQIQESIKKGNRKYVRNQDWNLKN